jgi:hypothetical protein
MATALAPNATDTFLAKLGESFFEAHDGLWYPRQSGEALVRIQVDGLIYRVFRRRSPETPWMQLVESRVEEFDKKTFTLWASQWRLVA